MKNAVRPDPLPPMFFPAGFSRNQLGNLQLLP
jgi:hypothetical protein